MILHSGHITATKWANVRIISTTYPIVNCATMEKAFEHNFGVGCFGQLLDLVVKEGLKEVPEIGELMYLLSTY